MQSKSKVELPSKNVLTARLLTNLKFSDHIGFIKVENTAEEWKWAEEFGRVALTNGLWKMRDRSVYSIVLLSKEILHMFLGAFLLPRGADLSTLKSIFSNIIKYHQVYRELLESLKLS